MAGAFDLKKQQDDVDSKLVAGFERLSQALRVLLWDEAKREGLSPIQVQILIHLKYNPGEEQRVSKLAVRFDLTKATISDAVKTLETKGLIARTPDPNDARAFQLRLTSEGRELTTKVEAWAERTRDVLSYMDDSTKEETLFFITELIEKLQRAGVITVARMCKTCRFFSVAPNEEAPYYCTFLEKPLRGKDLRVDCPEYQPAPDVV